MIKARLTALNASAATINPPFGSRAKAATAASMSASFCTGAAAISVPRIAGSGSELAQEDLVKGCGLRIKHESCPPDIRRHLPEHFQPLSYQFEIDQGEAGDVTARTRQACDEALTDRIVGMAMTIGIVAVACLGPQQPACRWPRLHRAGLQELCHTTVDTGGVAGGGKSVNDVNVAAFDPVERRKSLLKGRDARPSFWIILRD